MKFYSGRVRLSGSLLNEAAIKDKSAAECILLAHLHGGPGSLVDMKEVDAPPVGNHIYEAIDMDPPDEREWTDELIRAHLHRTYVQNTMQQEDVVTAVLGNSLQPLPTKLNLPKESKSETPEEMEKRIRAEIEAEVKSRAQLEEKKEEPEKEPEPEAKKESEPKKEAPKKAAKKSIDELMD